jgi:hypothetical protein
MGILGISNGSIVWVALRADFSVDHVTQLADCGDDCDVDPHDIVRLDDGTMILPHGETWFVGSLEDL